MPKRSFGGGDSTGDPRGEAAVAAYFQRLRTPASFPISCETSRIFAYPVDLVWQVVLETQHLGTWLEGQEFFDAPLPERFHRGFCISAERGPTYVLDCNQNIGPNRITFQRRFYSDQPAFYFTVTVTPYQRYMSKVSIRGQDPIVPHAVYRFMQNFKKKRQTAMPSSGAES